MSKRLPKATASPRRSMVKLRALGTATATATAMVGARLAVERPRKVSDGGREGKGETSTKGTLPVASTGNGGEGGHDWNLSSRRSRRQRDDECIDHLNGKVTGDCVALRRDHNTTKRGVDFNYPSG